MEFLRQLRSVTANFIMEASERIDTFLKNQLLLAEETLSDVSDLSDIED